RDSVRPRVRTRRASRARGLRREAPAHERPRHPAGRRSIARPAPDDPLAADRCPRAGRRVHTGRRQRRPAAVPCAREGSVRGPPVSSGARDDRSARRSLPEAPPSDYALEALQAAGADETDGPDRQTELPRDVAIRQRWLAIEQHRDHFPAARWQLRDGVAQFLLPLDLLDEIRRRACVEALLVLEGQLVFRAARDLPLPLKRLVRGHGYQPAPERPPLAQTGQL